MKNKLKIMIVLSLMVMMLVSCSTSSNENSSSGDKSDTKGLETPDPTVLVGNTEDNSKSSDEMIENDAKNKKEQRNLIDININPSDGSIQSAKVDINELIQYIDAKSKINNHLFNYDDAKNRLQFTNKSEEKNIAEQNVDDKNIPLSEAIKNIPIQLDEKDGVLILTSTNTPNNQAYLTNVQVVNKYIVGNEEGSEYLSVYDFNLNKKLTSKFKDFYYIADNYYAGSSDENATDKHIVDNFLFESKYTRDYRVDAIFDGENLTPFKYFVIRYLGNDVFYLSNGSEFYFMNIKTGEQLYTHVDSAFIVDNFDVYDGLIIGTDTSGNQIFITDNNYMIVTPQYDFGDLKVISDIVSDGVAMSLYPRFIISDTALDENMNNIMVNEITNKYDLYSTSSPLNETGLYLDHVFSKSFNIIKKGSYITIEQTSYMNGFGAHPHYGTDYYIIDSTTGKLVDEKSVFKDYREARKIILVEMANQAIKQSESEQSIYINGLEDLIDAEDLENAAYRVFLGDDLSNFNFAFVEDGMKILYNPYALASFATGQVVYTIPYELLNDYFAEDVITKLK